MTIEAMPWLMEKGAHSARIGRLLAYSAMDGKEGIIDPGGLKVTPLSTPGEGVFVRPGAASILGRGPGQSFEAYLVAVTAAERVNIAPTGSGAKRSDLIVARVENPFIEGDKWDAPADEMNGPYWHLRVIPGVPAGTRRLQDLAEYAGDSAITLARIDLPASTGTVTQGMIVDLRRLARPRSDSTGPMNGEVQGGQQVTTSTFVDWPVPSFEVDIPSWATHAAARVETLAGLHNANVDGEVAVYLGDILASRRPYDYNASSAFERVPVLLAGEADVRSIAGQRVTLRTRARRSGGSGYLSSQGSAYYIATVDFYQREV